MLCCDALSLTLKYKQIVFTAGHCSSHAFYKHCVHRACHPVGDEATEWLATPRGCWDGRCGRCVVVRVCWNDSVEHLEEDHYHVGMLLQALLCVLIFYCWYWTSAGFIVSTRLCLLLVVHQVITQSSRSYIFWSLEWLLIHFAKCSQDLYYCCYEET